MHVATSDGERQPAKIGIAPGRSVYVATIVRNDGPLPVTIGGLAPAAGASTDVYVPVSIELGDGKAPRPTKGAFVPPSLDPHTGIGVMVTYTLNPDLACAQFGEAPSEPGAAPADAPAAVYLRRRHDAVPDAPRPADGRRDHAHLLRARAPLDVGPVMA